MIYVITHKKFDDSILDRNHFDILHVGENDNYKDYYLKDSTGNSIAHKNPYYCELTGQYWIWKNVADTNDYIGLVHYRRYFTDRFSEWCYTYFNRMPRILQYSKIEKILEKNDIIIPSPIKLFRTARRYYADNHCIEDLDITRDVMIEKHSEYLDAFDNVMNMKKVYYGNMLICNKTLFDKYSEWLFDILGEVENRIDLNKYESTYQARVFGFLSERLLYVWISHNKLKVKELPAFNTEERRITIFEKNGNRLKKLFSTVFGLANNKNE